MNNNENINRILQQVHETEIKRGEIAENLIDSEIESMMLDKAEAESRRCYECGEMKKDDPRIEAGLKCGDCAYYAGD